MSFPVVIEHFAVGVSALTGVLAARGRGLDLFGVLVLAVVTAFGGGTVRDLLVGDTPVVWLRQPSYLYTALGVGLVGFFFFRSRQHQTMVLDVADAFALALFNVIGARKGFALGFDPSVAVMLGVMTGVAGGIVRDVLMAASRWSSAGTPATTPRPPRWVVLSMHCSCAWVGPPALRNPAQLSPASSCAWVRSASASCCRGLMPSSRGRTHRAADIRIQYAGIISCDCRKDVQYIERLSILPHK